MFTHTLASLSRIAAARSALSAAVATVVVFGGTGPAGAAKTTQPSEEHRYEESKETRELVSLVNEAAKLIETKGEAAFTALRFPGSRFRQEETYIFVLDPNGNMVVHPDQTMEGKNQLDLKDINGKPIIRGLISAATATPSKTQGWYHYEWPVPGGILPRWKSSFVESVVAPSGKTYVVGSGSYNDRMEKSFVVDLVNDAVGRVEKDGKEAFSAFRDPKQPFIAKDAYVFVCDPNGLNLVNPGFPSLEGRNLLEMKDTHGKKLIREMLDVVKTDELGWVEYMWPKPGESVSTQKSTYVRKAKYGDSWVLVGSGVYLSDAPKAAEVGERMTAPQLMGLVRDGAALLEKRGEQAFPELRQQGSKWFRGDTYFFVWSTDGTRTFHAADPTIEGENVSGVKDVLGRPYGKMFLDVASSPTGEGWVHYMYPEPGNIFPTWKSTFLKKVTFPSGKQYLVGSGIYNMKMDKAFVEDVVNRAAALVANHGKNAFPQLRDKTGPFMFVDTYVFVDTPEGVEVVNGAQPSLEGKSVRDLRDAKGKTTARDYIDAALKKGSAWVEYHWYKPGSNTPTRKQAFVKKVQSGTETFVVGSGLYLD